MDEIEAQYSDELIFHALADATRRRLLDDLYRNDGQRPRELSARYTMSSQAVAKHLGILEDAGLVIADRQRNRTVYYLNRACIRHVHGGWIAKLAAAR